MESRIECNDIEDVILPEENVELSILGAVEAGNVWSLEDAMESLDQQEPEESYRHHLLSKALLSATNLGRTSIVKWLLEHGAEQVVDRPNDFESTALVLAAIRRHAEIMSLLIKAGCSVNSLDMQMRSAIHWSAMNGDCDIVRELLENGANPDQADKIFCYTPLMHAAQGGHVDIVNLLLQYNCDVNATDLQNSTPLFDAVRSNSVPCVRALLDAGARINHADRNGCVALHMAVYYQRIDVLKTLIHYNCSLDVTGGLKLAKVGEGYTALEYAVYEGNQQPFEILVSAGAALNPLCAYLSKKLEHVFDSGKSIQETVERLLVSRPRPLKELARIALRKFLGERLLKVIDHLPLPKVLRTYMLVPEVTLNVLM